MQTASHIARPSTVGPIVLYPLPLDHRLLVGHALAAATSIGGNVSFAFRSSPTVRSCARRRLGGAG